MVRVFLLAEPPAEARGRRHCGQSLSQCSVYGAPMPLCMKTVGLNHGDPTNPSLCSEAPPFDKSQIKFLPS